METLARSTGYRHCFGHSDRSAVPRGAAHVADWLAGLSGRESGRPTSLPKARSGIRILHDRRRFAGVAGPDVIYL